MPSTNPTQPHVVIVGGGFAGLYAAKSLGHAPVQVTLVDRRNFHLFQPLLYQVATGNIASGDIASSLRAVFGRHKNVRVLLADMVDLKPDERKLILSDGELTYDTLVIATGVQPHYFGHDAWAQSATGLKTIEDAAEIRRRILLAFERAEREPDPEQRQAWMTFVIVGGGSAGVELAGALGELAHETLRHEFRLIDPADARILLIEAVDHILPTFPVSLSVKAEAVLARMGVTVRAGTRVTDVTDQAITVSCDDRQELIPARTILWTAGVRASPIAQVIASRTGATLDRLGRVVVEPDLTVAGYPNLFVLGDLASFAPQHAVPLPALAPVAIQQGQYVGRLIRARLAGKAIRPFVYRDKGNLAVIGRNAAVARLGRFEFGGLVAWLLWALVHIAYLIEFDHKVLVMLRWIWNYFTQRRGARLITVSRVE
jgi:NADH:quinone reductase (non-electrogenic)